MWLTEEPEPVVPSPKYQLQLAIPVSSVDVDTNVQTLREQLALNDATGAPFVEGAGEVGVVTVPPAPFTCSSRFGDPEYNPLSAPLVTSLISACSTVAGDAPGLFWR